MTDNEIINSAEPEDVLYDDLKTSLQNYASSRELKEYYQFGDGKLRYMAGFLIHNGWTLNRLKRHEDKLIQDSFELINRQNEEIDKLKAQLGKRENFFTFKLDKAQIEDTVKKEIEKIEINISEIRTEAIREFAERLIEETRTFSEYDESGWECDVSAISAEDIENLVKEMTEDEENG